MINFRGPSGKPQSYFLPELSMGKEWCVFRFGGRPYAEGLFIHGSKSSKWVEVPPVGVFFELGSVHLEYW